MLTFTLLFWTSLLWGLFPPAAAFAREVDLELVLAVDVSRSMSAEELELQRRGYAEALGSPEVIKAIEGGLLGRIALTYLEWAGAGSQRVIVPWTEISDATQAGAVALRIGSYYDASLRRTSISSALRYSARSIETNGFEGMRRVIDISGDGPNNMGIPVAAARDEVVARGITINGLPLMTEDILSEMWGIPDLDLYYTRCVIGGAGAFVVPVLTWDAFPAAVKRKMVLEIASAPAAPPIGAQLFKAQEKAPYDCLVGEKMWKQNRTYFDIP
ncbi:DUF1194 domain-containing protein [Sulfitobacter guttiformis]|uniref:Uncharacterized protein DUF1194 n=1 Tax=Sulfitobacter guttiformis TaxID=74349 RepID=A0A420DN77_9RHOB|nr:DUF1194 domain-containing protein [Sulfitobacter guttiformis]KIN72948.1 DUF1194 domain containing protein [Sulfitobacter guttiformis KCTC 32187]RKE95637.1 uncharacterized protein DUF1194 [Sulfitobacter guttiformis]